MSKNKILTNAVILLIILSLIFSSVVIAERTKETKTIFDSEIEEYTRCNASVVIEKDVYVPGYGWRQANTNDKAADIPICTNTKFRIRVRNTGDCPITGGVQDQMEDSLGYIKSDPEPDDYEHLPPFYWVIWVIPLINPGDLEEIIIDVHIGGPECVISYNHAEANFTCACGNFVDDDDYAYVHPYKKSKNLNSRFLDFIENHLNMFPILRQILGLL